MSKPSPPRMFMPVVWIVAVALLATSGIVVAGGLGTHRTKANATRTAATLMRPPALSPEQRAKVRANLETLPLAFEANQGQTDPQVKYMARGNGYTVFLTAHDTIFALHSCSQADTTRVPHYRRTPPTVQLAAKRNRHSAIQMHLVGANPESQIIAGSKLPGVNNYYFASDPQKPQIGVKQFKEVSYRDVYPGVNMAFHGEQRELEFDFVVAAGADPKPISLGFSGARKIATDPSGNLILTSAIGEVVLHKPMAYQEKNGNRENVAAEFVQKGNNRVGFVLGSYDRSEQLVIDPALSYSTYLGGSGEDEAFAIAVDAAGNVYVAGKTASPNFPAHSGTLSSAGGFDAFVTKLDATGSSLVFTTLISGNSDDGAFGIAVNGTGAYVAGNTSSTVFPSTVLIGPGGGQDVFVAKLNSATGIAQYITKIGGSGTESANGIAIDSSGNAYVGGETDSTDFPTVSPIQANNKGARDGFIAKLDAAGTALSFSTYLGGSSGDLITGIALDSSNNIFVTGITVSSDFPTTAGAFQTSLAGTGDNGFVTEIKSDGSANTYSTYLGGNGTNDALGIAVDSAGEAYVTGATNSSAFPIVNPAQTSNAGGLDIFVTKFNASGTALLFSTYYGGTSDETAPGIALDSFGDAYVTGRTASANFPVSGAPFQGALSGTSDAFLTELSNTGFVVYSSFMGGTGNENSISGNTAQAAMGAVAVDSSSNAYIAGASNSTTGFPLTSPLTCCGAFGGGLADAFVAKVAAAPADFSVAVSPTTISTTSGQTTSAITVTVSSVNASYGQPVMLSCGSLPSKAVCHFSPGSVTPAGSPVTSTLTIATNGASSSSTLALNSNSGPSLFYALLLLAIGGITLVGTATSSPRKRFFGSLALGLTLTALLTIPACGGGSGGGGGGGGGGSNTPPGTYNTTVSGQAAATHSAPLKLTVN